MSLSLMAFCRNYQYRDSSVCQSPIQEIVHVVFYTHVYLKHTDKQKMCYFLRTAALVCRQQHLESSLPPSLVPAPSAWTFHHYLVSRFQLMERSCSWVWEGSLYLLMEGGSSRGQIHPVAHHVIFAQGFVEVFLQASKTCLYKSSHPISASVSLGMSMPEYLLPA